MSCRIRERPPLRHHTEAITPDGNYYRWADDEPDPANIPSGVRHSDTMPGGYETHEAVLPRKPGIDYSDLERLTTIREIDAGGEVVGECRLERAPRVSGDRMAISPSAVGWQAHLEDDKSVCAIIRDVDQSRWQGPSRQRRENILGGQRAISDPSQANDATSGIPALELALQGPWAAAGGHECSAYYDAGPGCRIGSFYWDRTSHSDQASQPSASFEFLVGTADDDVLTGIDVSADQHVAAADSEASTFTPANAQRFAFLLWRFVPANATAGQYKSMVRRLAVYGDHDLTLRGTEPNAGFWASDAVAYAVHTWAPLLQFTEGETIIPSSFVIPHLAFHDRTTAAEIIRQATRFGLEDWAVWENKTFYWHARDASPRAKRWRARISPAQLEETGPQVDRLWNSVIVQYQDVDGTTRTVGPVGSGADTEDSELEDTDPENPANQLGITRRDLLVMGVSTAAGATEVGARFLEQSKVLDSSGRATLVGYVEDDRGVLYPYSRVRAGDEIAFPDATDHSYRRIVRADKARDTRTCTIDLDAPPEGLAALLERLGVVLVPLGV